MRTESSALSRRSLRSRECAKRPVSGPRVLACHGLPGCLTRETGAASPSTAVGMGMRPLSERTRLSIPRYRVEERPPDRAAFVVGFADTPWPIVEAVSHNLDGSGTALHDIFLA